MLNLGIEPERLLENLNSQVPDMENEAVESRLRIFFQQNGTTLDPEERVLFGARRAVVIVSDAGQHLAAIAHLITLFK